MRGRENVPAFGSADADGDERFHPGDIKNPNRERSRQLRRLTPELFGSPRNTAFIPSMSESADHGDADPNPAPA